MTDKRSTGSPRPADFWDPARGYLRVMLRDLETEASVGLRPWERHPERPTRLIVNVELFTHLRGRLRDETEATIVDYDVIRRALRTWPGRPHTLLLETLLDELVGVCFSLPRVEACRVSIVKPDVYNDAQAAGVEAYLLRSEYGA